MTTTIDNVGRRDAGISGMTEEYQKSRDHWLCLLLELVSAPDDKRDDLFESATMVFRHMKIVAGRGNR